MKHVPLRTGPAAPERTGAAVSPADSSLTTPSTAPARSGWTWSGPNASSHGVPRSDHGNDGTTTHRPSAPLNPKLAKLHAAATAVRAQPSPTAQSSASRAAPASTTALPIAGLNVRSLASSIDFAAACVLFTPLVLMSRHWFGLDSMLSPETFAGMEDVLGMVRSMVLMVLYLGWGVVGAAIFASVPMLSLGNRWMGMAVVDASTGRPPSVKQLGLRAGVALLDNLFLLGLGSFWMLVDPRRQGLRDKVARTVVIRDERLRHFP